MNMNTQKNILMMLSSFATCVQNNDGGDMHVISTCCTTLPFVQVNNNDYIFLSL